MGKEITEFRDITNPYWLPFLSWHIAKAEAGIELINSILAGNSIALITVLSVESSLIPIPWVPALIFLIATVSSITIKFTDHMDMSRLKVSREIVINSRDIELDDDDRASLQKMLNSEIATYFKGAEDENFEGYMAHIKIALVGFGLGLLSSPAIMLGQWVMEKVS